MSGHGHSHYGDEHTHHSASPADRAAQRRALSTTLVLVGAYLVAEVVGGLLTGSLALLADASHMASDLAALSLSLFAIWLADRPAGVERTFGHHRVEVLAALANGTTLAVVAVFIALEAVERLGTPSPVLGGPMMAVAVGGLAVNLAGLWILREREGHAHGLNVRGAWLHVLSDALGSVGAISAGALVWGFGWLWADPVASLLIAALVLRSSWALLRETVGVLMEAAPPGLDVDGVRGALEAVPGVVSVHDLYIWTITSGLVSLSCHVEPQELDPDGELLRSLQAVLAERFGIHHVTIQIEPSACEPADCGADDEAGVRRVG